MIRSALATLVLTAGLGAQTAPCYDFTPVDGEMQTVVRTAAPRGASLVFHKAGRDVYRKSFGGYTGNEVVPIASATKWLSGAVIMKLVDENKLSLDDTAGKWLPTYTGDHAKMTIRQLFSHTSGLPGQSAIIGNRNLTLAQAVDQIASVPLLYKPGTAFHYGGVSMHVAGRIAEIAGGKDWEALFKEKIANPLGMTSTDYQGLGATRNYRIAGGARSSLEDYRRFVVMLLEGGVYGGKRILSQGAVAEMFRDQTNGVPIRSTPHLDNRRYGIGCWTDRVDAQNRSLQLSSQGAFGFSPWVDVEHGLAGVFVVLSSFTRVRPHVDTIQQWTRANIHYAGVECYGGSTPACHGPLTLRTSAPPIAGDLAFAFSGDYAPARASGAIFIGLGRDAVGTPLLNATFFLSTAHPFFPLPIASDAAGRWTFPLPLDPALKGVDGFVQGFFANPPNCGGTVSATPALAVSAR